VKKVASISRHAFLTIIPSFLYSIIPSGRYKANLIAFICYVDSEARYAFADFAYTIVTLIIKQWFAFLVSRENTFGSVSDAISAQ
jgi:hypothetical protein